MAANPQTYNLIHDFAKGHLLGVSESVAGFVPQIPSPVWVDDSLELSITCYEFYTSAASNTPSDFGAAATVKLWVVQSNTGAAPTEITCETAEVIQSDAAEYDQIHIILAKEVISDTFAGSTQCLLFAQVSFNDGSGNRQRTIGQYLYFTDAGGDDSNVPAASTMPFTPGSAAQWETAPDDVAEALDYLVLRTRPRVVAVDATAVAGSTTVYTVPTGYYAIPLSAYFQCTAIVADGTAQTAKWQADAGDLTEAVLSENLADNDVDAVDFARSAAYPAATVFKYTTTIASTNSSHTGLAVLELMLYETE